MSMLLKSPPVKDAEARPRHYERFYQRRVNPNLQSERKGIKLVKPLCNLGIATSYLRALAF